MRANQPFGSGQATHLVRIKGHDKVDVSAKHHGVGNGEEMWSVLVEHADTGAEIRDATSN